ncbi:MAG TPA: O-antigen ligase family protein [Gaiellaceae bacterium]|nr:O-antigen ligase family protein [Gaiellaceae bacterium]
MLSRLELLPLAGLAGLLLWQVASLAWTRSVPLTVLEPQRTLVVLVALAAALLWLERALVPALLAGVLAGCLVLCLWNLAVRGGAGEGSGESAEPVGYANGLALLAVVAILLAAGLALEARPPLGVALLASSVPALVVLWLSESRGAWLALAAGAAAGAATRAPRMGAWLPAAVVAAGVGAGLAASLARSEERREYWQAALDGWRDRPLLGSGAGTWERSWLELRDVAFPARDAHSLYVEALSELGPLALALIAALLVPPLVAAGRARTTPGAAAGTASFAAVAVHLAVDWDWELPAVVLAGLFPGAALLVAARGGTVVTVRRAAVLVPAAVLAAATVPLLVGNVALSRAGASLRAGDAAEAAAQARRAARLQPWAAEPRRLLAEAELARGDRPAAERAVAAAVERDGDDVEVWRTAARVREGTGRRRAEARAQELDPRGSAAGARAAAFS